MGKLILQHRRMQEGYQRIERMSQLPLGIPSSTQGRERCCAKGSWWR